MKAVLITEPTYEILTPVEVLRTALLNIERAGRTCYRSEKADVTDETAAKFTGMIMGRHHDSVIEHSVLTVKFSNISRGLTHEQVRHRLAAYSQQSTRYVDFAKGQVNLDEALLGIVVPPHKDPDQMISLDNGMELSVREIAQLQADIYSGLRKAGWVPQDARQFLPIGVETEIVVTANFREWRHIFGMRTDKSAHWEIRRTMCMLLAELQEMIPVVFDDFVFGGLDKNGIPYYIRE